jgi:hypothetical protein
MPVSGTMEVCTTICGNTDLMAAACLELVDHFEPELRAFPLFDPQPENSFSPGGLRASAT